MIRSSDIPSAAQERAVFFPGEESTSVAGIITHPAHDAAGLGVVVLAGGGFVGATNRNRLTTRICRELARLGCHSVRFDWHGVGDSTGSVDRFRLDRPFVGDLIGAVDELRGVGVGRFLLFGSCFGARTALSAADVVPGVEAMLLVAVPVRRPRTDHVVARLAAELGPSELATRGLRSSVLRGLGDAKNRRTVVRLVKAKLGATGAAASASSAMESERATELFVRSLRSARDKRIDVTLMYGLDDAYYADLSRCGEVLNSALAQPNVRIETVPGELHRFQRVRAQELVLERVQSWGAEWVARVGGAHGGGPW